MATITCNQFAMAINDIYYTALDNPTKGLNAISLHDLVTHVHMTYMTISQPEIGDNMTKFHTGNNSTLPLTIYMCKQKKCQMFVLDAGVLCSKATMVTTSMKAALNCSGMELAWHEWKCIFYDGNKSTPTANLVTAKLLINSTILTPLAQFYGMDFSNFYLMTPIQEYKYKCLLNLIPNKIIQRYNLLDLANDQGWVYVEIQMGM